MLNNTEVGKKAVSAKVVEELYEAYYERLCYYINTFVPQLDICRDLIQEVFIKIIAFPNILDDVKNPEVYLRQMAKNKAIDYLRMNKHNSNSGDLILEELLHCSDLAADSDYNANELSAIINRAIENLPAIQKEIFILSRFQEKSYQEIATMFSYSPKTVEYHMSKALSALKIALKDYVFLIILLLVRYN